MNDLYLDSDGTLGISADVDISKVKRILLTQEGTHYGSMYYLDNSDHIAEVGKKVDSDVISRQAAIDAVHAMPDIKEIEKVIIDNLYIGDQKVTDLIASGRLRLVGFCEECKHCFPPLVSMVDGEVAQVTSERCSVCNGYVEKNGWCYKFERRTDE